jgi:MFS family permease
LTSSPLERLACAYPAGTFLAALPAAAVSVRHGHREVLLWGVWGLAAATIALALASSFENVSTALEAR